MKITASRSTQLHKLEGTDSKLRILFIGFASRSAGVDRGFDRTVFGALLDGPKLAVGQNGMKKHRLFDALSSGMRRYRHMFVF